MLETLGKYKIDSLIAEGGMARIFRAKTEGIGGVQKVVALKCLKGALQEDDKFVQMLRDEALITVNMTHKNICQVYGLEHEGDQYFMVMELIDGVSLADLANYLFGLGRVFPIEAAVFIAMEVCSGLSYAHRMQNDKGESLGIVHRDVNPQNICISKEGEVKLIDFGIAKGAQVTEETSVGTIKGKFNYMSPEQARGDRVDQRTDVFALGAVLYEILTGHMLYPLSLDDNRLRNKTRMADFVPIETYLPDIPDKLKKIIAKALTRDVNQRFASSRDFLLALTKYFHDSCKVYDSLNLSQLVEKYLSHKKADSGQDLRATSKSGLSAKSGSGLISVSPKGGLLVPDDDNPNFIADSGDTAIISAVEAKKIASSKKLIAIDSNVSEETATNVYSKAEFDAAVEAGLVSFPVSSDLAGSEDSSCDSLNRSVDLDIVDQGEHETVMFNMEQEPENPIRIQFSSVGRKLLNRIMAMEDRTLVIAAVALVCVLAVAIILYAALSSDDDAENDSTTEVAEVAADNVRKIYIESRPEAQIWVNGKATEYVTPCDFPVTHDEVTLKAKFHKPLTVSLDSVGKSNIVNLELEPLKGRVNFDSVPQGATVFVDKVEMGLTPIQITLEMSQVHHFKLMLKGFKSYSSRITWDSEENTTQNISHVLKPKEK